MARSSAMRLFDSALLACFITTSVLMRISAEYACTNCGPCGKRNRITSLFPNPDVFLSYETSCPYLPASCTSASLQRLELDPTCIPDCEAFARNASACRNFTYPGKPTIQHVTWLNANIQEDKISSSARIQIVWNCPTDHPENTVGFRIRLIDAKTSDVIDTRDVGMERLSCQASGFNHMPTLILNLAAFSSDELSNCEKYTPSPALTQNYIGRYIKSDEKWKLKVQILSLPVNGSVGLNSPQSSISDLEIDSCRDQKCPIGNKGGLTCPVNCSANFDSVFCLCDPLPPTNIVVTPPGNYSHWTVCWQFEDEELFRDSLQLSLSFEVLVGTTASGDKRLHEAGDVNCLNVTISPKPTGDTVWAQVRARVTRTVNDKPQNFSSKWAMNGSFLVLPPTTPVVHTTMAPPISSSSSSPDAFWMIPVIVLVLVVATLGLVTVLVWQEQIKRRKRRVKYLLGRRDIVANIVAKIQNIEPLLTVLIEHHILTFLSSGYRLVTNAATDQQVAKLIEVIRNDATEKTFSWFLYAIRHAGYDNLFESLMAEVAKNQIHIVDLIINPPPPAPLQPATARVYISYSRFKKKHEDVHYLCKMLAASSVHAVLDYYCSVEMADNEPQWIEQQIASAQFVIVVLDNEYPLNLPRETAIRLAYLVDDDKMRRTQKECQVLQGGAYRGRTNFVIPVQIGKEGSFTEVPALLRNSTCYRMPHNFLMNHRQFQLLAERILGRQQYATVQCHYDSMGNETHPTQATAL